MSEAVESQPASDAALLLPGEVLDSDRAEDVTHWIAVYEELLGFLHESDPAPTETLRRYQQRLDHWRQRREELARREGPGRESIEDS